MGLCECAGGKGNVGMRTVGAVLARRGKPSRHWCRNKACMRHARENKEQSKATRTC